jgi:hypothetical protein
MAGMIAQEMALLNEDRDKDSKFLASVVLGCTQHGGPDATPPGDEFILTLMHPPRVDLMSSREGGCSVVFCWPGLRLLDRDVLFRMVGAPQRSRQLCENTTSV